MLTSLNPRQKGGLYSQPAPVLFCGLGLVAILSVYFFFRPGLLDTANNQIYDTLLRSIPHSTPSSLPVIVDIDDESLKQYGQWPWPRYRIARLLDRIKESGARSIALDMFFPEPDRTSLGHLQREVEQDLGVRLSLSNVSGDLRDNDTVLAHCLSRGPFVLGYKFIFDKKTALSSDCRLHPAPVFVIRSTPADSESSARPIPRGTVCNLPVLAEAVTHSGFTNATPDRDGVLRWVPVVMAYKGKFYPSLALSALLKADGTGQVLLRMNEDGIESVTLGNRVIPLDEQGNLLVRFRGPQQTFRHIPAARILAGQVKKDEIKDHIVFIGTSAAGLKDIYATPYDPHFPGVETHAAIVDNIVQGDFLRRPQWMRGLELILGVLIGILSAILLAYGRAAWNILVFIISLAGLWVGARWLFSHQGVFVSPVIPLAIFAVNFSFLSALKFWREERKGKKRAQEMAKVQAVTLETIAMVIETRHTETGGHVKRTQHYVKYLARFLQKNKKYRSILDDETVELLFYSSPLHDVGKVGVPDSVLKNPGKLKPEEFEVMKQHTVYGKLIFDEAEAKLGKNSFFSIARTIAYTHHEKWDGSGYPQGLSGKAIPLFGRIMAIADIYDALISRRVYKDAMCHEDAAAYLTERGGKDLDPDVVHAFLNCQDEFQKVAAHFSDGLGSDIHVIAHNDQVSG
ncbi:MAG: hypothetical protein DSY89_04800 [Deltaproteobacteria bacterium]|nr:MAG: hypothetical protein DSY89_04800 [Deltaproteobacteria bacterium]